MQVDPARIERNASRRFRKAMPVPLTIARILVAKPVATFAEYAA